MGFQEHGGGGGSLALKEYIFYGWGGTPIHKQNGDMLPFRVCFFFDHPLINKVLNSKAFEDSL